MKAIFTFVLFLTVTLTASANTNEVKVIDVKEVTVTTTTSNEEVKGTEIARLYKYKNSRVKKALKFRTKANKSKMA